VWFFLRGSRALARAVIASSLALLIAVIGIIGDIVEDRVLALKVAGAGQTLLLALALGAIAYSLCSAGLPLTPLDERQEDREVGHRHMFFMMACMLVAVLSLIMLYVSLLDLYSAFSWVQNSPRT